MSRAFGSGRKRSRIGRTAGQADVANAVMARVARQRGQFVVAERYGRVIRLCNEARLPAIQAPRIAGKGP